MVAKKGTKTDDSPESTRARQEARLAYLKKNQPKSKEIAELQKKLGAPSTGGPVSGSESADAKKTVNETMVDAEAAGRRIADEYIPVGTFGKMETGISPEMQAALDRQNAYAQLAGNYTANEQFGIDALRSGLGGYLAPELQALREQRLREVDAEVATQQRQAALAAARGGARGAYATAQQGAIGQQGVQTRGNMEQDLFAKNADVIQARKEAFNNLVNQTEQTRFARKTGAEGQYAQTLGGEENVQRALKEFNISQGTNEALARGSTAMAGSGLYTGLYGTQMSLDQARTDARNVIDQANKDRAAMIDQQNKNRASLRGTLSGVGAGGTY